MGCYVRKIFSWLLLVGVLVLACMLGLGLLHPSPATANIRQFEETSGQVVFQSHQTLKDQHGHTWQAIAFRRIHPDQTSSFNLRLVAFPGAVAIDRTQPLVMTNSLGQTFTASDRASTLFTNPEQPEPNVGQYDLQPSLTQLQTEVPLQLSIPTINGAPVRLGVAPEIIQEWQAIAH